MTPYLQRLAMLESANNPLARNPASTAKGLFQFIDETGSQYGINAPFGTPEYTDQEWQAAQKFTDDNRLALTNVLGREPTPQELYLAHQQGAGGAGKLLSNPNDLAINAVGEEAVLNNGGRADMTAQQFAQLWSDKFGQIEGGESDTTMPGSDGSDTLEFVEIEAPDGQIIEFPATMADQDIEKAMLNLYPPEKPRELTKQETFANEHPIIRTVGRAARAGIAGLASLPDLGLLVPKTAALATGLGLEKLGAETLGRGLQDLGSTPTLAETSKQIFDKATGDRFQPIGKQDELFNLGGEIIASAMPFTKTPVGADALTNFMNPPSSGGAQAISAALNPMEALEQFAVSKVNPASILPTQAPKPKLTSEDLRKQSSGAYSRAKEAGGTLKPEFTNNFIETARTSLLGDDELINAMKANKPLADAFDDLKLFENQPINLDRAQALDETLGNMIDANLDNGRLSKIGNKIHDVQTTFREMIENADPAQIEGGKEGYAVLKEGRKLWSKSRKLADIEKIVSRAEMSDQPANAIKSGFRTLYHNDKRMRGFSEEERALIKKMAEETIPMEALRGLASRLTGIMAGAVHGPAGYVVGKSVEGAARGMRTKGAMNRADALADFVANGPRASQVSMTPNNAKKLIQATSNLGQR
jgi:hypothetical protein